MKYHEYINPAAIHPLCQKAIPSPLAPGLGANLGARGLPRSSRCLSDKQIEVMNQLIQLCMKTVYIYRY